MHSPQLPDPAQCVTKRATRLFTCNTTFAVYTQTLARKMPAQHLGIRCETSTTGTRATRGAHSREDRRPLSSFSGGDWRSNSPPDWGPIARLKGADFIPSTCTHKATVMPHFQAHQRLEVVLFARPDDRSCVPEFAPDDMRAKRFCERPITQTRYRGFGTEGSLHGYQSSAKSTEEADISNILFSERPRSWDDCPSSFSHTSRQRVSTTRLSV
jgi:hypothetical protein